MRAPLRPGWLALGLIAAACECGEPRMAQVSHPKVEITAPANWTLSLDEEPVQLSARAESRTAIESLFLFAGAVEIARCEPESPGASALECATDLLPADFIGELQAGRLPLRAVVRTLKGAQAQDSVEIFVRPTRTNIVIESPPAGGVIPVDEPSTFAARADNLIGLAALTLLVRGPAALEGEAPEGEEAEAGADVVLHRCESPDPRRERLACEAPFLPRAHLARLHDGSFRLVARATDRKGRDTEASVDVTLDAGALDAVVAVESPAAGETVSSEEQVVLRARAANRIGLERLTLYVGAAELASCEASSSWETTLGCEERFWTTDHAAQVTANGRLVLTARATDVLGRTFEDAVEVVVKPLRVRILEPRPTQAQPPVAVLPRAGSALKIQVLSSLPVERVTVTWGANQPLRTFHQPPWEAHVLWGDLLPTGEHRLRVVARDERGNEDAAELRVALRCQADADCGAGSRCCLETGTCHAMVGQGEECDCQRPCPLDQGCFPGTCGQTPRRCRPGCFPGSWEPSVKADRCTNEDGRQAYCSRLPAPERTEENKGGACAPADTCSVIAQDCPNLPLDRTLPAGPDNPAVPHNCVPTSPVSTACVPAGPLGAGQSPCGSGCGFDATQDGCRKGLLCVTLVDRNDRPLGPPTCRRQCPQPEASTGCGLFELCGTVFGPGRDTYPTGVCQAIF